MPSPWFELLRVASFLVGAYIVAGTLLSAIKTFVVPRSMNVWLTRMVFRFWFGMFQFRMRHVTTYEKRDSMMALFAPLALLSLPLVWVMLNLVGFMFIDWALEPRSLEEVFRLSGSSLLTLGFAVPDTLALTISAFLEAAIGLVVVALLIAYLPTMYSAFSQRELVVSTLLDDGFEDFHVDGLRLDAVHALVDESPVHILQSMAEETDARSAHLGRPLTLIAESDLNDPTLILPREAGGYGLTAQWSDDHHHAIHAAITGEAEGYYADFATAQALPKTSTAGFFHDGSFSSFRDRPHGFPIPPEAPMWRLVTFAQDHDQIGNRAAGDRLSQSLSEDELAVAAVLNLTSPFTPMLFMGEEWGASTPWQFFTSHPEPELGRATAEGRLAEFAAMGWDPSVVPDPQDPATFERSRLQWGELDEPRHARLLALHRALIRLRRALPELTDPRFEHTLAAGQGDDGLAVFRLDRGAGIRSPIGGIVSVCAAIREGASFDVGPDAALELATSPAARLESGVLTLPPHSAAIVRVRAARAR